MIKVLNNGYVSLLEHMGGDESVIRNARRCWRSEDKSSPSSDRNLIRHLLKAGHMTPFESMSFTFDVKAPLFVARQWMRHRIGSYNEESLRYCVAERDYYVPGNLDETSLGTYQAIADIAFTGYERLRNSGVSKEQARAILPLATYTKFYWTVNGSSLMNFLRLRLDKHAQEEIRLYAQAILELVTPIAPVTFEDFKVLVLTDKNLD